ANQEVGYQFFHDLNDKQIAVRTYIDKFKTDYNDSIDDFKKTITNLISFDYTWLSCVDYKSQIIAGDKADYKLFQKVVNAEKELYDYRLYAKDHIKNNAEKMFAWSKNRNYGSCVKTITTRGIEFGIYAALDNTAKTQFKYASGSGQSFSNEYYKKIIITNLHLIPVGVTDTAVFPIISRNGSSGTCTISVTRHKLNTTEDDGYFNVSPSFAFAGSWEGSLKYVGSDSISARTGASSPHFFKANGDYDLAFFKTRKLI
ncbi:MAG: hypothetical protein ACRC6E_13790, partial [Fusobacteriaceae bacterium]